MKIYDIAKEHDIKVTRITEKNIKIYVKEHGIDAKNLINNSYIVGDDEIILGLYDDKEIRTAAFFHEMGHTLVSKRFSKLVDYDRVLEEYQAWIEGIKLAKNYGFKFSHKCYVYMLESLETYHRDTINMYKNAKKT